ncbi:MAG: methane monooxygenase/ammonia monooxygenase subunit C, partial [Nitrospirae bacterium]|nr:methane monooxygenase/ammonia monooxygenase subunit C [Nitrospirota bacterium]
MASDRGYDISQWYDSKPVKLGWLGMLGIGVFWVVYQRTFGYSHGLDSMTPEFDSVWMGLWRFNILANAVFFAVSIGWIWV